VIDVDTQESATALRAAFTANFEAAREAARQIRLRDLTGIIVIDFIRMEAGPERAKILNLLKLALATDRRSVEVLGWTRAGLAEIIRSRSRRELGER
jgi:Rne/Rng family ribonuclease